METFLDWFAALPPRAFCVACLAGMYEKPEAIIRPALERLGEGVTVKAAECSNCLEEHDTYVLKRKARDR